MDRPCEHVAPNGRNAATIAGRAVQIGEPLEHVDEKCARSARRIQQGESAEAYAEQRSVLGWQGIAAQRTRECVLAQRVAAQRDSQRTIGKVRDQRLRRKECAAGSTLACCHQRLEGAPQHFGIHRCLRPLHLSFARRESVSAKQLTEERAKRGIGESSARVPPLERGPVEQAAIEKWNGAEPARHRRATIERRVQRPEEERQQHSPMKSAAGRHAVIEVMRQKGMVAVQPPFRLQEGEKEQS